MYPAKLIISVLAMPLLVSCASNNEAELKHNAVASLSSPQGIYLAGTGTGVHGTTQYIFASAAGTISAADNTLVAVFIDPFMPISINSTDVFSSQMSSGSCTMAALTAAVAGTPVNEVTTQIGATGCTDQAVIQISLDTTKLSDARGLSGTDSVSYSTTVDLAPKVVTVATGNTLADGTGTTESSAGVFTIASDNSIVVTFSKSVSAGTLTGVLAGATSCTSAVLGTGTVVANTNGLTVAWPVTSASSVTSGSACTLNVAGVTDAAGNPDDPTDTNLTMTVTFQ